MNADWEEEQSYGRFNDNNEMWSGLDAGHEAACNNEMSAEEWEASTEAEKAQHIKDQNELMRLLIIRIAAPKRIKITTIGAIST